jgi:hypothetical protein
MYRLVAVLMAVGLTGSAGADEFLVFKDWSVAVDVSDTGQDTRRNCSAFTGGDGLPLLRLHVSDGDAGPPDVYPAPVFEEYAPRGFATQVQAGDTIVFEFDDGTGTEAQLTSGYEDGVYPFAHAHPFARDVLWILQGMRRASTLTVYRSNSDLAARQEVFAASLNGFTSAYSKMMEACGFGPGAVME